MCAIRDAPPCTLGPMPAADRHVRLTSRAAKVTALALTSVVAVFASPVVGKASAAGCGPGVLGSSTVWKDRNPVYDFVAVCGWHDRCYAARGYGWDARQHPERASVPYPRRWCDDGFLRGMLGSCDRLRPGEPRHSLCRRVAFTFHGLVRLFGSASYSAADGRRVLLRLVWP